MPRAFLIKSRSAFPATRKENISPVNKHTDKNAQLTENLQQDSPSVDHELPTARISPANEVSDKSKYTTARRGSLNTAIKDKQKEAVRVRPEISNHQEPNTKSNTRGRKRSKRVIEQEPKEFTDNHVPKKVRKGQPKKTVVYYYATPEDIKARERFEEHQAPAIKDEPRLMKNYTHEKRHYPNEYSRYPEQASQSHGMPSENSRRHAEQTGSFAMQNRLESIERGKTNSQQNNEGFDKNVGLENVMIVEYHSMSGNRDGSYRPRQQKSTQMVTQHPPQGYYPPPRSSPVTSTNYIPTSSVTTTAPVQMPQPQRVPVQTIPKQEKETSSEPKVVYVPVYPVSQGPNGVIYEPIPNATPIMAKDTVHIPQGSAESRQIQQQQKQQQQQEQVRQVPQMVQAVPQRQDTIVYQKVQSPPVSEQKQRMEYRAYEPHMPQQLAAAPAPHSYQPHPQGHVLMQQQSAEGMKQANSPAYPTQATTVMQVPPYPLNRPPHPHQYQPGPEQQQNRSYRPQHPTTLSAPPVTTTDGQVQRYPAPRPTVTISQSYPEVPQQYGHYQRQSQTPIQHQGYQGERLVMQTVEPSYGPPVTKQQPIYQHRVSQPRPPPLPSQPQHAEKAALPSPSYPQESAKRLLTPRYTPDGMNDEQKFVYVPAPAEFMNSPVYRVPNKEGKFKTEMMHQNERAERVYHKSGSKKRKSSYPSHTVLYKSTQEDIPSPTDRNSRTPSPKETDLRCNERLVKSPNQPAALNKTSLVMTPPVSPTDRKEDIETVTVVVRDQGIQASPRDERGMRIVEHTCYRRAITHMRSNSYHSESSEEDYLEDEMSYKKSESDNDTESHSSDKNMYTEDGTVVVHIPYPETGTSNRRHRNKRGNYRFMCKFCSKGFQWHSHLESHERTHTGEKPFKCPECDRAFCRADGLQCHMLVHNKKRPFKCPYCGKGFNDKIVLEKHIYSHTGVKPFKCEYCGRAFSDSLSIEKHLLVHTGTKPYKCPYCVRSFNDSQMLVRHIRSHTGEKPFKCKHCPMAFSKQSALIIHTRVHTGEKPYQCSHCTKSFSISGNLQRHILIHTGERPYKCSKCPKAFNNPSHLSRHISKLHAPQPGAVRDQIKYEPFPDTGHMSKLHVPQPGSPNQIKYEPFPDTEQINKLHASQPGPPKDQMNYEPFHDTEHTSKLHVPQSVAPKDQMKYEPFPDTEHTSKLHASQSVAPKDQMKYEPFPDTEHTSKLHASQPGPPKDQMNYEPFPDTEHTSKLHASQPGPPKDQMNYEPFHDTEHTSKLHASQPGPPKDQMNYEPFHDTEPIYRAQAVVV